MDIKEILKLPVKKRINLVHEVWDSIPKDDIELTDEIKDELDNRLERRENGQTQYFTLEEVEKKLAERRK